MFIGGFILVLMFLAENYIDGAAFVALSLPEVREMVPPIGLAKKIIKLIPKVCIHGCLTCYI